MIKKISALFILIMIFSFGSTALAAALDSDDIRVLLAAGSGEITVRIDEGIYNIAGGTLTVSAGSSVSVRMANDFYVVKIDGQEVTRSTNFISLSPASQGIFSINGTKYRAAFCFKKDADGSLLLINTINVEQYLYGVLGKEIGYRINIEALKAQAVASRSFALASVNPAALYDVTATTVSQVYGGYTEELYANPYDIKKAINETAGEVLLYRDPNSGVLSLVPGYYHSNGGGYTERINNVWGSEKTPWRGVPSPYDNNGSAKYLWQLIYTPAQIAQFANNYGKTDIGTLLSIKLSKTDDNGNPTASGRATKVEIIGSLATVTATKDGIRAALGNLPSTLIDISFGASSRLTIKSLNNNILETEDVSPLYVMGADGKVAQLDSKSDIYVIGASGVRNLSEKNVSEQVIITGQGTGHGVGMSQAGAVGMADAGYTYQEILSHYYFGGGVGFSVGSWELLK